MNFAEVVTTMRKRKLVQTLIVYAGASWGVLQALGFFAQTYAWPRAVIDATIFVLACGLVAALTVAWFHGREGDQHVSRLELSILGLVLLVAAAGGWGLARRSTATADAADGVSLESTLAVLPFENKMGNPSLDWYRQGLADMLATGLAQSPKLHVVSGTRVLDLLNQEGVAQASIVPEPVLVKLARKASAGYLVRGVAIQLAGRLRLQAEVMDASTGLIAVAEHADGDTAAVLQVVDSLAARLARRLLRSDEPGGVPTAGIAELATANLDAYREYQLGLDMERKQRTEDAAEHYRRAVALDSTFPQALMHLARQEMRSSAIAEGMRHLDAARRHLSRSSERDRLMVEGALAVAQRDTAGARSKYELLTRRYPDEKEGWEALSQVYAMMGQTSAMDSVLREVLVLDPAYVPALNQLAYLAARRKDYVAADSFLGRYLRLQPEEPNPWDTRGEIREIAGRYAEARADYLKALRLQPTFLASMDHLARVATRAGRVDEGISDLAEYTRHPNPAVASKALAATAELLMWKGQADAALAAYRKAMPLVAKLPSRGMRLAMLRPMADIHALKGDHAQAVEMLQPFVRQGAPSVWGNYISALIELGRMREIDAMRDSIRVLARQPGLAPELRGNLELMDANIAYRRGDLKLALERFAAARAARGTKPGQLFRSKEVLALIEVGRAAETLPMIEGFDPIQPGFAIVTHDNLYLQGRIWEANGRRADAIRVYERLMADWGATIRQFPRFRDTPDRLARLKKG